MSGEARPRGVAAWRIAVAVLALSIGFLYAWVLAEWPRYSQAGDLGVALAATGVPQEYSIARLEADSPIAAAGGKVGERVRFDHARDPRRLLGAGEPVGLTLGSGEARRHVEVAARASPQPSFFAGGFGGLLTAFVSALALAIATSIGWRLPDSVPLRWFVLAVYMQPLNYVGFRLPTSRVADFLTLISPLAPFALAFFGFAAFCLTYPDGAAGPARRRLRLLLWPYGALALAIGVWGIAELAGIVHKPVGPLTAPFAVASVILSVVALALGWREAVGEMRARMGWIAVSMGLVYLSYLWGNLMLLLGLSDWMRPYQSTSALAIAAGYFGLAYALLRHRVFDIGFAVNRALVYTVVSAVLLVSFGLLEWGSHKLIHFENQRHNTLLDAGIAIAVFLTFHHVRDHTEHAVERIFFHAWQVREAALRKFVKQAAHMATAPALVEAFRAAFERYTGGARCCIYRAHADGRYELVAGDDAAAPSLGVDHPVAVQLRTEPEPVALEAEHGAPGMALALPMSHRGELAGIVLLGPKQRDDAYRPDEVQLLGFAAHQVGLDLHALEVQRLRCDLVQARAEAEALRSVVTRDVAGSRS